MEFSITSNFRMEAITAAIFFLRDAINFIPCKNLLADKAMPLAGGYAFSANCTSFANFD